MPPFKVYRIQGGQPMFCAGPFTTQAAADACVATMAANDPGVPYQTVDESPVGATAPVVDDTQVTADPDGGSVAQTGNPTSETVPG